MAVHIWRFVPKDVQHASHEVRTRGGLPERDRNAALQVHGGYALSTAGQCVFPDLERIGDIKAIGSTVFREN